MNFKFKCKKGGNQYDNINSECHERCGWNNDGKCAFYERKMKEEIK